MNRRAAVLAIAVLNAAACRPEPRGEAFLVRDSAAVEIVENVSPAWAARQQWSVAEAPSMVVGAEGSNPATQLFVVYHAVLQDSAIVVANNGTSEIRIFDLNNDGVAVVGGRGDGPGEFNGLQGVHACRDGRLLAIELRRISVLSSNGEFIRTVRLAPDLIPTPGNVVGALPDCSAVIVERGETEATPATNDVYNQVAVLSLVPLEGTEVETIARIKGPDLVNVSVGDRSVPQPLPWGRSPVYAVGDDMIYVGASDSSEVQVYGRSGLERIIRWPAERKPVGDSDRRLFDEELTAEIREDGGRLAQLLPALGGYPHVPDRKPAYARLLFDPAGFLWIREYQDLIGWNRSGWDPDGDGATERWWVIDSQGRWLGSVMIPQGLRVLGVQDDYLIAIAFDAHEVERLQLHRIVRSGAEPG